MLRLRFSARRLHGVPSGARDIAADRPGAAGIGGRVTVAVDEKNGVDAAIAFQATRVSTIAAVNGGAAPDYTNQLAKIRINNGGEVMPLDILQFHSGSGTPCSPLSTDLEIEDITITSAWPRGLR